MLYVHLNVVKFHKYIKYKYICHHQAFHRKSLIFVPDITDFQYFLRIYQLINEAFQKIGKVSTSQHQTTTKKESNSLHFPGNGPKMWKFYQFYF